MINMKLQWVKIRNYLLELNMNEIIILIIYQNILKIKIDNIITSTRHLYL